MKDSVKATFKRHFSATHIAYMALFTSLAFVVTFLEFPIFSATPWFKLDFANVFFMFEGFLFGPVESVVSILIKELLCLTKTSAVVGEVANFLMSVAYIILPSVAYRFKKGRGWVALYLVLACVLQIVVSLPANAFITYPVFFGEIAQEMFSETWYFVIAFNVVKSVAVSLIVFVIYKPLSRLVKLTREKIERKTKKEQRKEEE